jgi:flagellar FliL protein
MKKIVFAVMLLIVLGGGAAGAYFYFGKPANASVGESDEHHAAKEASDNQHKVRDHAEYVELDPLILPIIDQSGVTQVISMVVVIEVADKYGAAKVTHNQPRLKDAYIQELYGVLNKRAALSGGVVQVNAIKNKLKKISHDVMGDEVITDVLLQVVQQRPM